MQPQLVGGTARTDTPGPEVVTWTSRPSWERGHANVSAFQKLLPAPQVFLHTWMCGPADPAGGTRGAGQMPPNPSEDVEKGTETTATLWVLGGNDPRSACKPMTTEAARPVASHSPTALGAPSRPLGRSHLLLLLGGLLFVPLQDLQPSQHRLLMAELALQPPALFGGKALLPGLCLHLLLPLEELREVPGPVYQPVHPGARGRGGAWAPPGAGAAPATGGHAFH